MTEVNGGAFHCCLDACAGLFGDISCGQVVGVLQVRGDALRQGVQRLVRRCTDQGAFVRGQRSSVEPGVTGAFCGEGAGFVEDHCVHLGQGFQHIGTLEEESPFAQETHQTAIGEWHAQRQRTRAGHNEHRCGGEHRLARVDQQPNSRGHQGNAQDDPGKGPAHTRAE